MRTPVETNFPRIAWTFVLGILLNALISCGGNDVGGNDNPYRSSHVDDEPQGVGTQDHQTQDSDTTVGEKQDSGSPNYETPEGETSEGVTREGGTPEGETPGGETPEGKTPEDETPDDETRYGETPEGETPDGDTPDGEVTLPPKVSKAKHRACELTSVGTDIQSFVSRCQCKQKGNEDNSDDYTYEEYDSGEANDADLSGHPTPLARRMRARQATEDSEESQETPADSTATTGLPSSTASTSHSHILDGVVVDGTPCLALEHRNTTGKILTIGVCHEGACTEKNASIHFVAYPGLDPYEKHCKVNTTLINTKLRVAVDCIAKCLEPMNKTWNETKLDDGRPCALVTEKDNNEIYIKRTGACRNGSCVLANLEPWRHPRGCVERTVKREGRILVESCWLPCANGTTEEVPDGTPCLLNHLRTVAVPPHVSKIIDEGICKHGQCIITPPAFPTLAVFVPEEGCTHAISSINYTHKVAATCGTLCHDRRKAFLPLRTPCALQSSGNWPLVTKAGECLGDVCIEKGPDTPPIHQTNEWSTNCRNKDYLTIVGGKFSVVQSCQVECNSGVFEKRQDGVRCLLEFTERRVSEKINFVLKTYKTGVCDNGYCTLGKFPRTDLTLD